MNRLRFPSLIPLWVLRFFFTSVNVPSILLLVFGIPTQSLSWFPDDHSPLPDGYEDQYIVGVTVQWDRLYLCEPIAWVPMGDLADIDLDEFYAEMLADIEDEVRGGQFVLSGGEWIDAHAELYGEGRAVAVATGAAV